MIHKDKVRIEVEKKTFCNQRRGDLKEAFERRSFGAARGILMNRGERDSR